MSFFATKLYIWRGLETRSGYSESKVLSGEVELECKGWTQSKQIWYMRGGQETEDRALNFCRPR